MSDTSTDAGADIQPVAPIQIVGQYIKDLSFEVPHAPDIFDDMREKAPDIPISIDCSTREIKENTHEVTFNLHLEATVGEKAAFILEVTYASVVVLGELPAEHVRPVLLIEVPRQMFPFVRQIVADTTVQGGFPPLMLQLVDFMDLYRRKYATEEEKNASAHKEAVAMAKMTGGPVAGQNL
jgi:preprotein translocase subunit SecB